MPISCEPCRQRKIRCPRTKPGPCSTCVRRNIPSSECIYAAPRSPRPDPRYRRNSDMAVTTTPTEELVERIGVLENLLRDHIAHWEFPPPDDAPPLTISAAPSDLHTPPSDGGIQADCPPVGRLITSNSGHTRCQPFHSTWDSAIVGSDDGIDDPLGQAFNQPLEDLISPLPPVSQCSALIENFFTIFSPVSLLEC